MSEDKIEDPTDEDESKPSRGTASRPSPFSGVSPEQDTDPEEEPIITIISPDGFARKYLLTDDVKQRFENKYTAKFESGKCEWHDMWWSGTKLVIEYYGHFRSREYRPDVESMSQSQMASMFRRGHQMKTDGIPRAQHPALDGKRMTMQDMMQGNIPQGANITVDMTEEEPTYEYLDEGVVPIHNIVEIDLQDRADAHPLSFEDLFTKPWASNEGDTPINSEDVDGELSDDLFEVDDFRDFTDGKETVAEGARGDRFNL